MATTRGFGSVRLFEACPICGLPVNVEIVGTISEPTVELEGKNITQAMNTVNAVTCTVAVTALVVQHDCRSTQA